VEELHNTIEAVHEEDGQGQKNTFVMGEWKSVDREKSYRYTLRLLGLEK